MIKLLIFLVVCFKHAPGLKLETDNSSLLTDCVQRAIKNIFDPEQTLMFVYDSEDHVFSETMTNPYMISRLNRSQEYLLKVVFNEMHMVMHLVKFNLDKVDRQIAIAMLKFYKVPKKTKFLLITHLDDMSKISEIFEKLWAKDFENVVVIAYNDNNEPKIYYSDPFAAANECRQKFNDFIVGDCNSNVKYEFPKVLRKRSHCNLTFFTLPGYHIGKNTVKFVNTSFFVLELVANHLNMTFSHKTSSWSSNSFEIAQITTDISYFTGTYTNIFLRDDTVWTVPSPVKISPIVVLKIVFKPIVWASIALALICTSIVLWLLAKYFDQNGKVRYLAVIFDLYSVTILGSTNKAPVGFALRSIFISYVIYSIHIQTAFTSNLVNILTIPQYEPHIQTLTELADSNLSILAGKNDYLVRNKNETGLYAKIYNKLDFRSDDNFTQTIIETDSSKLCVFWNRDLWNFHQRAFNKTFHYFVDNFFSGSVKYVFVGGRLTASILLTMNELLDILNESDIIKKHTDNFQDAQDLYYRLARNEDNEKVVITLEHVCSIFALWGLGLLLAFLVFLGERLAYKIQIKKSNNV